MRQLSSSVSYLAELLTPMFFPNLAWKQLSNPAAWMTELFERCRIQPNIRYLSADNYELKLDLYIAQDTPRPNPTLIYIHGGDWRAGNKEKVYPAFLPYLEMGFSVVNVEYRLAPTFLAPAAVEDCLCALRWVIRNAKEYNFDTDKIVVTGRSAGGHLALTTGMLPAEAGLDLPCPEYEELKVAGIINWYGITDVGDLLDGPNQKAYAVAWIGSRPNRYEIAEQVSPINYIREGLPPVLTIHGDADNKVPYTHAVRLHEALNQAAVPNELLTISGGRHGRFSPTERLKIYEAIRSFLIKHDLLNHEE